MWTKDRTHNLVVRLRHNVIRAGLYRISLAYWRISLADVAAKLGACWTRLLQAGCDGAPMCLGCAHTWHTCSPPKQRVALECDMWNVEQSWSVVGPDYAIASPELDALTSVLSSQGVPCDQLRAGDLDLL